MGPPRLAILASHPVQYYAPLFREVARRIDLHVFYAHNATPEQQASAGFGQAFMWDVDLTSGYSHSFLRNVASRPGTDHFAGCDTPEIGTRLREGRFDAVLTLGWHLKSMLQGIIAAKRQGVPVMVRGDSHLSTPRSWLKKKLKSVAYPRLLRLFDAALYVGERNRDYYRHYGYPESRLFHSPHCVDTERFAGAATPGARAELRARLGLTDADKVVLFAGKLIPLKRPLDIVEALAGLRHEGVTSHLMVVGSGPLDDHVRERAREKSVPLHMLGFQNQTEMPAAYAAADILCLPSKHETWGLVCNEAIACGTPIVVSSEVGCAPNLASKGGAGRIFAMGDVADLARAIASVLNDPHARANAKSVSERFSLARAADGIIAALEAVRVPKGTARHASSRDAAE
jgi:glycosyltransferase involved in cell wall biosynthesis